MLFSGKRDTVDETVFAGKVNMATLGSGALGAGSHRAAFVHDARQDAEWLNVFGEIDIANADEFEAVLSEIGRIGKPIVVDLKYCSYLDSCALHILTRANTKWQLRIEVGENRNARRILELLRASEHLSVTYSRADGQNHERR